jgi:TatD DNase family protein
MPTRLIDTHCHVHFSAYKKDMDEVIRRALADGVFMIVVGTQITTSQKAIEVAKKYDGIWAAYWEQLRVLRRWPVEFILCN